MCMRLLDHVINVTSASFSGAVKIERDFDPSLPDITADKALLIQAFLNLLKNACEACQDPSGGKVRVITSYAIHAISSSSMQARERYLPLQIDIIDNGPGIPEAISEILFEPFISNKAEGSGLGLAVVASAIAEHGGVVRAESNDGETHFQILLPISPVVQINNQENGVTT